MSAFWTSSTNQKEYLQLILTRLMKSQKISIFGGEKFTNKPI